MANKQTTAKGFTILSAAGIINKFLALAYVTMQTWIVGNYGNGLINTGYRIYTFIFALSNAGIPVAIAKLVSETDATGNYEDSKRIFRISTIMMLCLGIFFSLVMATQARFIAKSCSSPDAYLMILALSPTLLFTSISSSFRGYFQGKSNMIPTAISQVLEQFVNSVLTIVFAALFIKYGVDKAAAGTTIGTSMGALCAATYLIFVFLKNKKYFNNEIKQSNYKGSHLSNKAIIKKIMVYGLPIIVGTMALNISDIIDTVLVKNRLMAAHFSQHDATALFGILSTQYQRTLNLPLSIVVALPTALIPAISAAAATKDFKLLSRKIYEAYKVVLIIIVPCAVGLALLPKPIISMIYFSIKKYNQGGDIMTLGVWVLIILAIINIQQAILIGIGKQYIAPLNLLIGIIIKITINYFTIAIPSINVRGAVIGTTIGYSVALILNQIQLQRHLKLTIKYKRIIMKPFVASILMGIVAYLAFNASIFCLGSFMRASLLLNDICVVIAIFAGIIVYSVTLIYVNGIKSKDIVKLPMGHKLNNILTKSEFLRKKLIN